MGRKYGAVDKYIYEMEAEEIGGIIVFHYGNQGSAKTTSMWQTAKIDIENDRTPFWRAQDTCQWIGLAAQGLPVTLWIHESVKDFQFYLTGDRSSGEARRDIDIESMPDVDVQIKYFSDCEEMVRKADVGRCNAYFIPGDKSNSVDDRYFFYDKHRELFEAFNDRDYGDHIVWYADEIGDVLPPETKQPFYELIYFILPKLFGNFRKNGVSAKGTAHDSSEIFHKFRDKSNTCVYHTGARVKHKEVKQSVVNGLDRGSVVIPGQGFEMAEFDMPHLPHDTIPWMPENNKIRLRMEYEAEIPKVVPEGKVDDDVDASIQEVKRDTKVSIARKIYRDEVLREDKKVSQGDLARVFDKSKSTINDWVNT